MHFNKYINVGYSLPKSIGIAKVDNTKQLCVSFGLRDGKNTQLAPTTQLPSLLLPTSLNPEGTGDVEGGWQVSSWVIL